MSIRTRIISIVVAPVIIVTVILSLLSTSMAHDSAMVNMEDSLSSLDASYALNLETQLENFRTQVEWLAKEESFYSNELRDTDKVKILQQLAEGTDVTNAAIFGADGKNIHIMYTNGETLPAGIADVSSRPYFSPAMGGETVVFGPSKDVVSGDLLVTIASRVTAKTAPACILAVDFSLDAINAQVDQIKFNETGRAILLDSEGMILSSGNKSLVGESYKDIAKIDTSMSEFADIVPDILNNKNGKGYFNIGKVENAYAYRQVNGSDGWILVTMVESDEYYAASEKAFFAQWAVAAVLIVITVLFALLIGNTLAKPIQAVSKAAENLSQGHLVHPDVLPRAAKRKDEIGTLVRSMDSAVDTLESYINDISDKLGSLANNNFDIEVDIEYLGEFEAIKSSMNQIVSSLNSTMVQITQAANQVDSGSSQVSDAAQALSQGATEQASSTEEISATMISSAEEMKNTAVQTTEAMSKTGTNNEMLSKAKISMDSMLNSMAEIDRTSEAIGKIIKTIDDIAFQTNILALNAAVEAARAGQHGRGFAVVADEVRNLAAKSAEAASETNQLILSAKEAVTQGVTIAQQTAEEIEETTRQSAEIASIIGSVEEAVTHQADNFNQLNMAVEQISIVTQTNSATAEESAAASEELSSMSHMLKALVSGIKLKNQANAPYAQEASYSAAIPQQSYSSQDSDMAPPPPSDNYFGGGPGEEVW